jgi:hypothetical protein
MQRVAPSVIAREQLHELLSGGADRGSNIVSALVETVTRLVVQELLEGEQADYLVGGADMSAVVRARWGRAMGMRRVGCVLPRARSRWRCRRCAVRGSRFGRR